MVLRKHKQLAIRIGLPAVVACVAYVALNDPQQMASAFVIIGCAMAAYLVVGKLYELVELTVRQEGEIGELQKQLAAQEVRLNSDLTNQAESTRDIQPQIAALRDPQAESENTARQDLEAVEETVSRLIRVCALDFDQAVQVPSKPDIAWLEDTRQRFSKVAGSDNRVLFLQQGRRLTQTAARNIAEYWGEKLGRELSPSGIGYLAHRIEEVDRACAGRLASSIEDAVVRALLAQSVEADELDVVEIGTLFGVNAVAILDTSFGQFGGVHITCIDPLFGYYDEQTADITTSYPITEEIVHMNLRRHGFNAGEHYRIIRGLSEAPESRRACSERPCNYLFIDGDHSYEGVQRDYSNYVDMVAAGGLILFDDYGAGHWPGVKRFIDEKLATDSRVVEVGRQWRTIAFRKIG